jgi:hypothetical protein
MEWILPGIQIENSYGIQSMYGKRPKRFGMRSFKYGLFFVEAMLWLGLVALGGLGLFRLESAAHDEKGVSQSPGEQKSFQDLILQTTDCAATLGVANCPSPGFITHKESSL